MREDASRSGGHLRRSRQRWCRGRATELATGRGAAARPPMHFITIRREAARRRADVHRETCTILPKAGHRLEANAERHEALRGNSRLLPGSIRKLSSDRWSMIDPHHLRSGRNRVTSTRTSRWRRARHRRAIWKNSTWKLATSAIRDGVPGNVRGSPGQGAGTYRRNSITRAISRLLRRGAVRQGEGDPVPRARSAANSAVCFCSGITAVDPTASTLFSSASSRPTPRAARYRRRLRARAARGGHPDLYSRYTRERAAICSTVIHTARAWPSARSVRPWASRRT